MDNFPVILENANFICYSMCRQTRNKQLYARPSENPESCSPLGFLLRFIVALNQANYRLSLSPNHLQTRWQTTPVMTATKNETNNSITKPLLVTSIGAVTSLLYYCYLNLYTTFFDSFLIHRFANHYFLAPLTTFSLLQNFKKGLPDFSESPIKSSFLLITQ